MNGNGQLFDGIRIAFVLGRDILVTRPNHLVIDRVAHDAMLVPELLRHVGRTRSLGPTGVDADDFERRIFRFRILKPAIQNRMRPSRIAARDHDEFCVIQIVVAGRWRVRAPGTSVDIALG